MTDPIAEAGVRDEAEAVDLIRSLLSEHLDDKTALRRIHEVLDTLPGHIDRLEVMLKAVIASDGTTQAALDELSTGVEELKVLLTDAHAKAAASEALQKLRLDEERKAKEDAAANAEVQAKKAQAAADKKIAAWKENTAIAAGVLGGLYTLLEQLGVLSRLGGAP